MLNNIDVNPMVTPIMNQRVTLPADHDSGATAELSKCQNPEVAHIHLSKKDNW